jgi:hypothetical protein
MEAKKVCTKCKIEKPLSEFHNSKSAKDGKTGKCKKCIRDIDKDRRRGKNPELYDSKKARKKANEEAYLRGNKICNKCDEEKSLDLFVKNKKSKDGRTGTCKACENKRLAKFREENREELRLRSSEHYKDNKDKIKARNRVRYHDNIEWERERSKKYRENHLEEEYIRNKKYKQENKERINLRDSAYQRMRRETDPLYRLICNVRSSIKSAYENKSLVKESKTKDILGCDWATFEKHLNNNPYGFTIDMEGLDLDHIVPISLATNEEEVITLNHYTNFQLLPSEYNRHIKSDSSWNKDDFENWLSENWSWES